tara:strand:+ start:192 stop:581 length:390 start_codon:yes stop_codon:yes gene_type:complete
MRELRLIDMSLIYETEEHDASLALKLAESILIMENWTIPIAVEYSNLFIMDGHHRFNAAKNIGLKRLPCILMDYKSSGIKLHSWRSDIHVSIDSIFSMVRQGKKYPYKTTRHIFQPPIDEINVPLELLY